MSWLDGIVNKLGYAKREEAILNSIPKYKRDQIIDKLSKLYDTSLYTDPLEATKNIRALENGLDTYLNKEVEKGKQKGFPLVNTSTSILGYEPAGSTLKKLYPNPFAPYSFIGNNHWACLRSRAAFREDCFRDGFVFVAPKGTSKKKLKLVQTAFDDLDLENKMLDMMDHVNVYGNCWIDRDTNALGGLKGLVLLLPEKMLPVIDTYGDLVIGWQYAFRNTNIYFKLDQLDHIKTYNLRSYQLGSPSLSPVLTDVEADLYASIYANMMFQKGGLIRAIVSLGDSKDSPDDVSSLNTNTGLEFAQQIWELFSRQFAGVRGGSQLTFLPNVKNVYPITNPKDLEGPYKETSDRTAMKVSQLLGISPRRLNIHTFSQYENKMAVEDSEALDTDNHRYYISNLVFNYINKIIIREYLGIDDVQIAFSGEYGSISKNAAEFAQYIANSGADIITVNEFRVRCLHWEPLEGQDGDKFLGNIKNAALLAKGAANSTDTKEMTKYLEKLVGPRSQQFTNNELGLNLTKYKLKDLRRI